MMIKLKTILDLDTIYETVDFQLADNVAKKKRWAMGNIICILILISSVYVYIMYEGTRFYQKIFMVNLLLVCVSFFYIGYVNWGMRWLMYWNLYRCYYPQKVNTYTEVKYTFSDDGILIEKDGNSVFTTWDSLKIFRAGHKYYYMKINQGYYVIRKANIADKLCQQLEEFVLRRSGR